MAPAKKSGGMATALKKAHCLSIMRSNRLLLADLGGMVAQVSTGHGHGYNVAGSNKDTACFALRN